MINIPLDHMQCFKGEYSKGIICLHTLEEVLEVLIIVLLITV